MKPNMRWLPGLSDPVVGAYSTPPDLLADLTYLFILRRNVALEHSSLQ